MRIELFTCVVKSCAVPCPPNRQEALLAAISEKDANIALLELSSSKKKKTQEEVALLKREKDRLVQQLKQQVGLLIPGAGCMTELTHIGIVILLNLNLFMQNIELQL